MFEKDLVGAKIRCSSIARERGLALSLRTRQRTPDITDGGQQGGRDERTDAGDLDQSAGHRVGPVRGLNPLGDCLHLAIQFGEMSPECGDELTESTGKPFSASSRISGRRCFKVAIPFGTTRPNSARSPRIGLACPVRAATKPRRARCKASSACCSGALMDTKRGNGRDTASQMPSASATSCWFALT